MAERDRDLAASRAGIGLPIAEAAHVGHGGARQSHRLFGIDIGVRRRRFRTAWQQHANDAHQNAMRSRKNMTLPTFPGSCSAAFEINLADRLEAAVRIEAMFLGKNDANETRIFVKFDKLEFD